ncbi:MAG: hypothetical protein NT150_07250 [Bacteroidetes bacterium]|nr:hypothetical protein [Bacteroidota bacterium]
MTSIFKNTSSKLALLLLASAALNGCHKKDTLGSEVCPSAAFKVTTPFQLNLTSVNPATDKLTMKAGFTEVVEWWITIKGDSLGVKSYTGKSDSINIDFYGNSENDHFFKKNENVQVKFELGCGKEGGTTKSFTYTGKPTLHNINFGMLLNDFDGFPSTGSYSVAGGWGNDVNKSVMKVNNITVDPSPQGGKAMLYYGFAKDSISTPPVKLWYYGGFTNSIATQIAALKNTYGITDPDRIYLNMYVRGYLSDYPNTQLQLSLEGITEETESGTPASEFKLYNLNLDWDGWKMVSIKFSEFVNLHPFTSTYNSATNSNITNLGFGLGAGPEQNKKSKALIDFLIITVDAPYKEVQKRNY